jgi:hypothetical protein
MISDFHPDRHCLGSSDRTLIDAGTFYPPSVSTAAGRLTYYASR